MNVAPARVSGLCSFLWGSFACVFCLSHQKIYSFVISKPQLRLKRFPSKEHNEQLKMLSSGASAEILLLPSHKTSFAGRDAWLTELQAHLRRSVVFLPNHFFAISGKQLIRCTAKAKTGWSRSEHLRKSPCRIVENTTRSFSRIDSYTALCSRWTLTANDVGKAPKPGKSITCREGVLEPFLSWWWKGHKISAQNQFSSCGRQIKFVASILHDFISQIKSP